MRKVVNLLSVFVIIAGVGSLAKRADASSIVRCTDEQWDIGYQIASEFCDGASFALDCYSDGSVGFTLLQCAGD